jgi:hypothetical protein
MDLSLTVFAMFKMSSKERLPLCLTADNCTIMPLEIMDLYKSVLENGWNQKPIFWLNEHL